MRACTILLLFCIILFSRAGSFCFPLEVVLAGAYLEVQFGYAEVHFGVAHQGELASGANGGFAIGVMWQIFEVKFLLIDGCGCQAGCFHAVAKSLRCKVGAIAYLFDGFSLRLHALGLAIAERYHALHVFAFGECVCAVHLAIR